MDERQDESGKPQSPLATFHKDFDSFKKAVDRAIERDPYGTLFGRRLQSPPTSNNSSWTSFSWIFDPQEIKEDKAPEKKPPIPHSRPTPFSPPAPEAAVRDLHQSVMQSRIPQSQSAATEEYEYDPISMRKVPKQKAEPPKPAQETPTPPHFEPPMRPLKAKEKPAEPARKTFFETLFGEHGVDIPVKTYKPPKVYGYGAEQKIEKSPEKKASKSFGFETSRKHEIAALKAVTLGNTIDTTAEYGGKYSPKSEAPEPVPQPRARDRTAPSEAAPLFSGTTYENKSDQILKAAQPKSDWLRKEGFGVQGASKTGGDAVDFPVKMFTPKLEPSLDRTQRVARAIKGSNKTNLHVALDRGDAKEAHRAEKEIPLKSLRDTLREGTEDLTFLGASDVRAAARTARVTKQDKEEKKMETRKKLERDFMAPPKQPESDQTSSIDWGRSRLSKSLDNVRKHVQDYPDGIVARTVKSMGIFNDNWKTYSRPEPKADLTQPLKFNDESLSSLPSIHKPRRKTAPSISFIPSKEVIDAERLNKERTSSLQRATANNKLDSNVESAKASDLAKELKKEYETEYGQIDAQHRQVKAGQARPASTPEVQLTGKPHPLSKATVKEGVVRHPAIEQHVGTFEPQYSKLVEEAKDIRRVLFDVQTNYRFIKTTRDLSSKIEAASTKVQEPKTSLEETSAQGLDKPFVRPGTDVHRPTTKSSAVPEPVFTPNESPVWNDEQPPPVAELKETFKAPYVILKYIRETGQVARFTSHFHEAGNTPPPSPLKLLGRLKHQEKFLAFFPALEDHGYQILSGDADTLIFKIVDKDSVFRDKVQSQESQRRVAAEEASAQLVSQVTVEKPHQDPGVTPPPQNAATVLDEIPIDVEPIPGPAAPTAPPTTPASKPTAKPTPTPASKPVVRRQEDVFSGTKTTRFLPTMQTQAINPIDPETAAPRSSAAHFDEPIYSIPPISGFRRFVRTLKRIFLTTFTVGAGAYVVGVITEGLDAKAQQKGIVGAEPRKKIVMTDQGLRQRPGIFSTESSR